MSDKIRILVHAGAPSSRSDDAAYQNQAEAYLAFQGHRTESEVSHQQGGFLHETQLAFALLESQLATSSLVGPDEDAQQSVAGQREQNRSSLRQGEGEGSVSQVEDHRRENSTPNEHIAGSKQNAQITPQSGSSGDAHSNSTYLKTPILPSRKRALGDDHSHSPRPRKRAAHSLYPIDETKAMHFDRVSKHLSDSGQACDPQIAEETTTSELPTTYSLSAISTDISPAKNQRSASQCSTDQRTSVGSIVIVTDEHREHVLVGAVQRPDRSGLNTSAAVTSQRINEMPESPFKTPERVRSGRKYVSPDSRSTDTQNSAAIAHLKGVLSKLSTMITPPEPKVGQATFVTNVTDQLQFLLESPHVGAKYRPTIVSRELRLLERGHWLVDSSSWPLSSQINFWQFLEKIIGSGNVGWGVWCTRESDEMSEAAKAQNACIGPLKLFCWGEIVQHTYLMLYVASKGKVRNIGLRWVDATGEVVVQMRDR